MVESVIRGLIGLALLVGLAFLVLWVLGSLGIALPAMVVNVFWIIVVLIAILFLYRTLKPHIGGFLP